MTLITTVTAPNMTSDASFRDWGKSICDTLISLGWVRATDTGNINWTTVTRAAINTPAGWEIFCMADTLQSTNPVFLKLEFGTGASTTNVQLWMTVGTQTNGTGTLTGQVGTRWSLCGTIGTSVTYTSRYSGANNRLLAAIWQTGASGNPTICIERTHDASGADTNIGIMVSAWVVGSSSHKTQFIPFTGTVPADRIGSNHASISPTVGTGALGVDVYLFPYRMWGTVGELSPSLQVFYYFNADLTAGNAITTVLWDGSSHSIYPLGSLAGAAGTAGGASVIALRND